MSQIKAELILASKNAMTGDIIYTFKLTFPRIILSEVNTHTIVSKNTASSRAIPTKRQLSNILKDPFIPESIGYYQAGMVAGSEIVGFRRWCLDRLWSVSRYPMLITSFLAWRLGASKQFSNRLVEPWMMVEQISTTTDVENETMLRNHNDAEPHYHELMAKRARIIEIVKIHFAGTAFPGDKFDPKEVADVTEKCQVLGLGQWHLPFDKGGEDISKMWTEGISANNKQIQLNNKGNVYIFKPSELDKDKPDWFHITLKKALSCARCAWISYESPSPEKMNNIISALLTYNKLILSHPKHLSPTQHIATPMPSSYRVGNLCGWFQHRKEIDGEAGGDKVVISVTPELAIRMLKDPVAPISLVINNN